MTVGQVDVNEHLVAMTTLNPESSSRRLIEPDSAIKCGTLGRVYAATESAAANLELSAARPIDDCPSQLVRRAVARPTTDAELDKGVITVVHQRRNPHATLVPLATLYAYITESHPRNCCTRWWRTNPFDA